jgi:hypothetical protein
MCIGVGFRTQHSVSANILALIDRYIDTLGLTIGRTLRQRCVCPAILYTSARKEFHCHTNVHDNT